MPRPRKLGVGCEDSKLAGVCTNKKKERTKEMKKLMIAAFAVASCTAFAEFDPEAKADGFYDVQMTLKRLVHVEKTVSKTFQDKRNGATAAEQYADYLGSRIVKNYNEPVTNLDGYTVLNFDNSKPGKISFKFKYFDLTVKAGQDPVWKSKILSETYKGLYAPVKKDDGNGKVYLWSTLNADKVKKEKNNDDPRDIIQPKSTDKANKQYSGYVAYEVPLAMHGEFQRTHDDKVAGGFTGKNEFADDGTPLDFGGLTAFGTGTKDKDGKGGLIKSVAGNVASKSDTDKVGAYGTWKINRITSSKFKDLSVKQALAERGCVELINEAVK